MLCRAEFQILLDVCPSREAYASCGYSPFLCFEVEDLQTRVQKLLELGAVLDGPIKYAQRGKVTCRCTCAVNSAVLTYSADAHMFVYAGCSLEVSRWPDAQSL